MLLLMLAPEYIALAISNIKFIMIGHRIGHQSGQDESSAQTSTTFQSFSPFRVYLFVSILCKQVSTIQFFLDENHFDTKGCR